MQFSPALMIIPKKFSTDDLVKLNKIHKQKKHLIQDIKSLEKEMFDICQNMKKYGCIIDGRVEDPKTRFMRIGIKKFNTNPKLGIQYLIDKKVVKETALDVAKFLLHQILDKKTVGEYLGNISNHFNCEVLYEFIEQFDFTGMDFIEAIRLFLSSFHLPGESQKIDKIIQLWSEKYNEQNPGLFHTASEAYIMTYAVIMLNTCLHNPTAKKINGGFGREQDFLEIMRKSDQNINMELVKHIFKSIKNEPLSCMHRRKENFMTNKMNNVEMIGWLWKLGGKIKTWKKRWFVLADQILLYLVHPESQRMKGMISLQNVFIRESSPDKEFKYCFEICSSESSRVKGCKNDNNGKTSLGNHSSYKISCRSEMEMKNWMESIQRTINTIWQMELLQEFGDEDEHDSDN